jgi:hypothetical protein
MWHGGYTNKAEVGFLVYFLKQAEKITLQNGSVEPPI